MTNEGEGGKIYPNNTPFTVEDLMRYLEIYRFNYSALSPQLDIKLWSTK